MRPVSAASAVSVSCLRSTPYILSLGPEPAAEPTESTKEIGRMGWGLAGGLLGPVAGKIESCRRFPYTQPMSESIGRLAPSLPPVVPAPMTGNGLIGTYPDALVVTVTY